MKIRIITLLISCLWIVFTLVSTSVVSQSNAINFGVRDGLHNADVTAIAEDNDGYILLGTSSGLVRFDGVDFTRLGFDGAGELPKDIYVNSILVGNKAIWVKSELDGIFHWDLSKNLWTRFDIYLSDSDQLVSPETVTALAVIDENLWFSCPSCGLSKILGKSLKVEMNTDKSGRNYRAIAHEGEEIYAIDKLNIFRIQSDSMVSVLDLVFDSHTSLLVNDGEYFYTSYTKGLFCGDFSGVLQCLPDQNIDHRLAKIIGANKNRMIVLFPNAGFAFYYFEEKKWELHTPQPYSMLSIPKANYNVGFIDSRQSLWIGSSKGVSCISSNSDRFKTISNNDSSADFLLDVVYDEQNHNYIAAYASEQNTIKVYDENFDQVGGDDHHPLTEGIRSFIKLDQYQNDIFGLSGGLYIIDPLTGVANKYKDRNLDKYSYIRNFEIDEKGILYFVTFDFELIGYDLRNQDFLFEYKLILPLDQDIRYQVYDVKCNSEYVAMANSASLVLYDKISKTINNYILSDSSLHLTDELAYDSQIIDTYLDKHSLYLTSRTNGVFRYELMDFKQDTIIAPTHFLSNIYSPTKVECGDNDCWIATDNGLFLTDTTFEMRRHFTVQHGLDKSKLTLGFTKLGEFIFLDGDQSLVVGDLSKMKKYAPIPEVDIECMWINDHRLDQFSDLSFGYRSKDFRIHVTAPIYIDMFEYKYEYRLSGHQDQWLVRSTYENEFRYDNLDAGVYSFEVRAVWNSERGQITKVDFTISPPFWDTLSFKMVLFGLIGLGIYLFFRIRMKKQLEDEKMRTTLAKMENTAIRSQLNPHFIFNSLNSIRSMVMMDQKENSISYLEQFSMLVREILQFSKLEYITLAQEIALNQNYLEIEKYRFIGRFEFQFLVDEAIDTGRLLVPPMLMQPFIENAIWHGLLHKDGDARLTIAIREQPHGMIIEIDDNGVGRTKAKSANSGIRQKTKSELGIHLSKKRIEMLGAKASVKIIDKIENHQPKGTQVVLAIPKIYKHEED